MRCPLPRCRFSSWTGRSAQQSWASCFDLQGRLLSPVQWSSSPIRPGVASRSVPAPGKSQVLISWSLSLTLVPRNPSGLSEGSSWSCVNRGASLCLHPHRGAHPSWLLGRLCRELASACWCEGSACRTGGDSRILGASLTQPSHPSPVSARGWNMGFPVRPSAGVEILPQLLHDTDRCQALFGQLHPDPKQH